MHTGTRTSPSEAARPPWLLLLAGAVLFVTASECRSLWLDELHTLFHVRADDLGACLASIRTDNHPPLSFLLVRWSSRIFGESQLSLRLPSILAGLVGLALVHSIARRLPGRSARRVAGWMLLGSSYYLLVCTEARMYALMSMAVLGVLASSLDALDERRSAWWVTLWAAIGLHSHYYFMLFAGSIVLGLLVIAIRRPGHRRAVSRLMAAWAVGGLLFLPWFLWGFTQQIGTSYGAGKNLTSLRLWLESIAHLLFIGAGEQYPFLQWTVIVPGLVLACGLGALGVRALWKAPAEADSRRIDGKSLLLLLLLLSLGTPACARLSGDFVPKLAYNWRYIAGACGSLMMLLAAGCLDESARAKVLGALVLAALYTATLLAAVSPGREDYRGASRYILEHARPGDVVLINPAWSRAPERSPNGWDFYAQRLPTPDGAPAPPRVHTDDWTRVLEHPRVWALVRHHFPLRVLTLVRERSIAEEVVAISPGIQVFLFTLER